jgi:hypothetical protein
MNSPDRENENSTNDLDHDSIARRAYEKWESSGRRDGENETHWYDAERELREQRQRSSSTRADSASGTEASVARHGPAPQTRGKPDRGLRPRTSGIQEAAGGENIPV